VAMAAVAMLRAPATVPLGAANPPALRKHQAIVGEQASEDVAAVDEAAEEVAAVDEAAADEDADRKS
jgi:hypothetical protein